MLGVCYYPEHWSEDHWPRDAQRMYDLGLRFVRIGEFAWGRIEKAEGIFDWAWMDRAIDVLGAAGLKVVLGTPTATPPKWLCEKYPDILPVDINTGQVRGFGSRRHYDFSSETYLVQAERITAAMAQRYGSHPHVAGWQTDNELCCHDTTMSASPAALEKFRAYCAQRYGTIAALNAAWGNVFWSMEYDHFDQIDLPFFTVCETNPAHRLAYRRFASEQVVRFHDVMISAICRHAAPHQWVTHNIIPPATTGVDNAALTRDLDFVSYDNYPLGFSDQLMAKASADEWRPFMRTGHPDLAALNFDSVRGLSKGAWWVMEQQPGPVNWAPHNPRPAPGMVRHWTLQAFAHGAACVAYFRYRQVPFAQEQMHAGLRRPDDMPAAAWAEVEQAASDMQRLGDLSIVAAKSPVAIVIDPVSGWVDDIERQGAGYRYDAVVFQYYRALRGLGVDVDFVSAGDAQLAGYRLVVVPTMAVVDDAAFDALHASDGILLFGPRAGAKTDEFSMSEGLPPGRLRDFVPVKVTSVETLRVDCGGSIVYKGAEYESGRWRETIEVGDADIIATYEDGAPAAVRAGRSIYLATLTDDAFLTNLLVDLCAEADVQITPLPPTLRLRRRGELTFGFNLDSVSARAPAPAGAEFVIGGSDIEPYGVAVWR
ncbi:MAG: beta-galactosidase [Sphingomonadales bacterium 35-56-22]|uniref:beta-galactosidase n=1 Tax=Sphingorhabdus sp. TaxID=1902408 RepID=UPI000BD154D9|nr:beta-galactosidase [Sphingorhabdus sp.]OYY15009.1 MAG: beta-galactosidase [Sphingomonadales bacterium 35-56-22]OYY96616.1 MAG: beta-galactosidase [Sphingomonadales bacterium 28-56-43]OYZ59980.1 MAG: beta-galactosidase [Sphingomonadales bacterium 24-56-14]OZA82156.1 MAG: beta-galactosidase [Sphingomonadales bacterium 39-57-19]HQS13363.1 beta-galactosidase [Sphingorhabdus sp.]